MTTSTEPKNIRITTPKGIAKFPRLDTPDTKFKASGIYSCRLILSAEDSAPIIEEAESMAHAMLAYTKDRLTDDLASEKDGQKKGKLKKALADLKLIDPAYRPVFDDEGEETGSYEFNFKMNATRTDKKTGKTSKMAPKFFDAKGNEMGVTAIWGGSTLKISGQLSPFYTALGVGVSLRLSAVQIIKLVCGGGGDAASYGFNEEEGYEAPAAAEGFSDESATDASSDSDGTSAEKF